MIKCCNARWDESRLKDCPRCEEPLEPCSRTVPRKWTFRWLLEGMRSIIGRTTTLESYSQRAWSDGCKVIDEGRNLEWRLQFCECGKSRMKPGSQISKPHS